MFSFLNIYVKIIHRGEKMQKYYYKTLSKAKRQEIIAKYDQKYAKSDFKLRLTRLLIYSFIGYIFSIFLIIYGIIRKESLIENLLIAIPLIIASTIFLIGRYYAKIRLLNEMALKEKK